MATTKKEDKITIRLNTKVAAQWFSSDRTISLYDGSLDGRLGITSIEFNADDLDKLPKRELAMGFVNNLLDIEGWDALEWLKTNRKSYEPPKVNTTKDQVFALGPNATMWQSKDGTITLSILPGGKTSIEVSAGDPRMHEFLYSVRAGTLIIVKSTEEAPRAMDKDPSLFYPEGERDTDIITRAKTWLGESVNELVQKIRDMIPEDKKLVLDKRNDTVSFLKAIIQVEQEQDKPREKVIERAKSALIDLGEFVELSSTTVSEKK